MDTESEPPTPLAKAIRAARNRLGLTLAQAGIRCGLDGTTIWYAEQGKRQRPQTVVTIAKGLGADPAEWLEIRHRQMTDDLAPESTLPPITPELLEIIQRVAEEEGLPGLQAGPLEEGISPEDFEKALRKWVQVLKGESV